MWKTVKCNCHMRKLDIMTVQENKQNIQNQGTRKILKNKQNIGEKYLKNSKIQIECQRKVPRKEKKDVTVLKIFFNK